MDHPISQLSAVQVTSTEELRLPPWLHLVLKSISASSGGLLQKLDAAAKSKEAGRRT
jgi:hypothetical protein